MTSRPLLALYALCLASVGLSNDLRCGLEYSTLNPILRGFSVGVLGLADFDSARGRFEEGQAAVPVGGGSDGTGGDKSGGLEARQGVAERVIFDTDVESGPV